MKEYFMRRLYLLVLLPTVLLTFRTYCQPTEDKGIKQVKAMMIDGKYRQAIDELNSIIKKDSSDSEALFYLGLNYEDISDYYKAAVILQKALVNKPDDVSLLYSLGDSFFSSGLINQADTILTKTFSLDSTSTQTQILLGKVLINEQNWDRAAAIYIRLIDSDSTNSYFYEQEAKCQSELGNTEKAINFYSVANLLNPKNIKTTLELSYLLYLQNEYKEAIKVVDTSLKYYRFNASLYERKADIYMKMEDYLKAVINYHAALAYGDTSAENLKNIGISLYWKGQKENTSNDFRSAINFLEHSAEGNSEDAITYFYLGALYKDLKNYNKSLDYYLQASNLLKNKFLANTYVQIGAVCQLEAKYKDALAYYEDAFRENPSDKIDLFYIGSSYDKLNDKSLALNYFKKFIKESPDADKKLLDYANDRIKALR